MNTKQSSARIFLRKIGTLPRAFVLRNFLGWRYTPVFHWLTRDSERIEWFPSDDELQKLIIAEAQRRKLPIIMDWQPDCSTVRGWWISFGDHPPRNDSDLIVALVRAAAVLLESEK